MKRKQLLWIAVAFCCGVLFFIYTKNNQRTSHVTVVVRVIDGDSLEILGGQQVRLLGVDTPEYHDFERNRENAKRLGLDPEKYHAFAEEATEFVKNLVLHQNIRLEYDPVNSSRKHRDKHGRLLAYVWLEPPFPRQAPPWAVLSQIPPEMPFSMSLNASLVRAGYSFAGYRFPYREKELYKHFEREAQKYERGFWESS